MRFLLDENIPKDLAMALRDEGHDVLWVPETELRGAEDDDLWAKAAKETRWLVTADLDFPLGEPRPPGMILLRGFDRVSTAALARFAMDAVAQLADETDQLLVVSPGRIRRRKF